MKIRLVILSLLAVGRFNGAFAASAQDEKLAAAAAAITLQASSLPLYAQTIKGQFEKRLVIASDLSDEQKKKAEDEKIELLKKFDTAFIDAQKKAEKFDDPVRKEKSIKRNLELYTSPMSTAVSSFRRMYGPEDPFDKKMRQEEEARFSKAGQTMPAPLSLESHSGLQNIKKIYNEPNLPDKAMTYFKNKMRELDSYQKFGTLTTEVIDRVVAELSFYLSSESWKNDFSW